MANADGELMVSYKLLHDVLVTRQHHYHSRAEWEYLHELEKDLINLDRQLRESIEHNNYRAPGDHQ